MDVNNVFPPLCSPEQSWGSCEADDHRSGPSVSNRPDFHSGRSWLPGETSLHGFTNEMTGARKDKLPLIHASTNPMLINAWGRVHKCNHSQEFGCGAWLRSNSLT
jgi:hypothetical protein